MTASIPGFSVVIGILSALIDDNVNSRHEILRFAKLVQFHLAVYLAHVRLVRLLPPEGLVALDAVDVVQQRIQQAVPLRLRRLLLLLHFPHLTEREIRNGRRSWIILSPPLLRNCPPRLMARNAPSSARRSWADRRTSRCTTGRRSSTRGPEWSLFRTALGAARIPPACRKSARTGCICLTCATRKRSSSAFSISSSCAANSSLKISYHICKGEPFGVEVHTSASFRKCGGYENGNGKWVPTRINYKINTC